MMRKNSKTKHDLKYNYFCTISEKGPVGYNSKSQEWCKMGPDRGHLSVTTLKKVETLQNE